MSMREWEDRFEKKPARSALRLALIIFGIVVVLSIVGWAFGVVTLPFRSASGVIERTLNPDNVLYNYEWFKKQNEDVKAIGTKLAAAEQAQANFEKSAGSRDTWKFDDRTEWNRLNAIVLGLRGQRADMVTVYNARSKMVNRSIFKTGDLPAELQ